MADNLPPPSAGGINKIVDPHEATLLHPAAAVLSSNSKEAYFQLLRCWVQQASLAQNASACFPYYLMANYPQMYAASTGLMPFPQPFHAAAANAAAANAAAPGPADGNQQQLRMNINRLLDNPARNTEIINQNGGYEYVIAPLWKRFVAEAIDAGLLFIAKLFLVFMLIDIFEMDFGFDFDAFRNSVQDDYTEFISLSADMIYIELACKIAGCIYEAMCTRHGLEQMGGATPGKIAMGLRVLYVEAYVMLPAVDLPQPPPVGQLRSAPMRALVFPAQNLGFRRAMMRAVAKNVLMTLMFPVCFIMLFHRNNQTVYDVATKSIVVEEHRTPPVLRRL